MHFQKKKQKKKLNRLKSVFTIDLKQSFHYICFESYNTNETWWVSCYVAPIP